MIHLEQEKQVRPPGWEDPLEEEMATHSSILYQKIPWTEEAGGVPKESDMTEQQAYTHLTNKGEQTNGSSELPLPIL